MIKQTLLSRMDYLHGDVVDDQFRAACQYEYARESDILRKAAELFRCNPSAVAGEIFFHIESEFSESEFPSVVGNWLISSEWRFIWRCSSFPAKSWNQLSEAERTELLYGLPLSTNEAQPLRLGQVMFLTPYLDQLKAMADRAREELKEAVAAGRQPEKVYPILELKNTPFVQVLLPLDFRKSKKRIVQEIGKWLELTENKARFDKHKPKTEAGTEKEAKDRLKDLAAWRLFDKLGWEKALEFAEQYRKRDASGEPRPFHDPRKGRKENEAPLYSWQTAESAFRKAKVRVDRYLAQLIPWEFGKYAHEAKTFGKEMVERFNKAIEQARKTSTNSS
jgi:hypothetical protein